MLADFDFAASLVFSQQKKLLVWSVSLMLVNLKDIIGRSF